MNRIVLSLIACSVAVPASAQLSDTTRNLIQKLTMPEPPTYFAGFTVLGEPGPSVEQFDSIFAELAKRVSLAEAKWAKQHEGSDFDAKWALLAYDWMHNRARHDKVQKEYYENLKYHPRGIVLAPDLKDEDVTETYRLAFELALLRPRDRFKHSSASDNTASRALGLIGNLHSSLTGAMLFRKGVAYGQQWVAMDALILILRFPSTRSMELFLECESLARTKSRRIAEDTANLLRIWFSPATEAGMLARWEEALTEFRRTSNNRAHIQALDRILKKN